MMKRVVFVCFRSDMAEDYPIVIQVLEDERKAKLWKSKDPDNRTVQEWIVK